MTDEDRQAGKISIPADLVRDKGKMEFWLIGENRYGPLKKKHDTVAE